MTEGRAAEGFSTATDHQSSPIVSVFQLGKEPSLNSPGVMDITTDWMV